MRYTKKIRRAISISPTEPRFQLVKDYYYCYLEYINGGSWKTIEAKFFTRMWLEDFGIWNWNASISLWNASISYKQHSQLIVD